MPRNGTKLLLYKGDNVIGRSQNVSFSVEAKLPEITSKDSYGWKEFISTMKSSSITLKCLTDYSDNLQFEDLQDSIITSEKSTFVIQEAVNPDMIYRGDGYITSVNETGEFNSATSFDVEINITGIFTVGDEKFWENVFREWQNISDNWEDV